MKDVKKRTNGLKRRISFLLALALLLGTVFQSLVFAEEEEIFTLDGAASAVYELEEGQLSGTTTSVAAEIPGYTGSGYVTGLASAGSTVSFDVNVTKAGIYGLSLRSALYIDNLALGKSSGQTSSHVQTSGNVTDGNPERGSYWGSGQPVSEDEPKWIQLDLGSVMPIHMVRIRIVPDWGARTQTFSVLGSVDNQSFITLKESAVYSFEPAGGRGNLAGNYVDALFDTAEVRYVRILFTAVSDQGANGAQVSEFEVYSPVKTAQLYLDGVLVDEITMEADPDNIVEADWDTRVLSWAENEIGDMILSAGKHTVSIHYGGSQPGSLNLDGLTFSYKGALNDEAVINVINMINDLKPLYLITAKDTEAIAQVKAAYDALDEDGKALIQPSVAEKLNAAVRRLGLLGEEPAIQNLFCYDSTNAGGWQVMNNLQIGDISHSDRDFTFSHVPPELWGCDWVRPAMESKRWNSASTLVTFDVTVSTDLYVAWDSSTPIPSWLSTDSGFTQTGLYLTITNPDATVFDLYKKPVLAGDTVSLGYLGRDKATYLILLEHFSASAEDYTVENTDEYPVLDQLTVNDSDRSALFEVKEELSVNAVVYGDASVRFTEIPEFLLGSAWISPASASGAYGGETLLSVTVNRDGDLYLAVQEQSESTDLTGFEKTEAVLKTDEATYLLYRRYVNAGSRVELPAQNDDYACYIPIMKVHTVGEAPDRPAISRFMAPFDTDGWYFVRENLSVGSVLFTNADTAVTALPALYQGCDYIQTYRDDKKAVYFYAEREIEVAVTVDSRITDLPAWLTAWESQGNVLTAGERTYRIFTRAYAAGSFITVPQLTGTDYDNYIVIVRPLDEGKTVAQNPLVEEGETRANETESVYHYYVNDVFNTVDEPQALDGYISKSGTVKLLTEGEAVPNDLAFRHPYTYSSATTDQYVNATDGLVSTYWEAKSGDDRSYLAVNLGCVKAVDRVVIKLNPAWGARTQTFSVEGSADGITYTELVASKDYEFTPEQQNTVQIALPANSEAAFIRLSFSRNTGAPGAQVAELQVYGSEMSGVNRYLTFEKNSDEAAVLERTIFGDISQKLVVEYKIKTSAPDRNVRIALTSEASSELLALILDTDGYLKATNGGQLYTVSYYQPDTWYTVKLVIDLENGTYDLWTDHLRRAEGLKTEGNGDAAALTFSVCEDPCILSIDNVRVYDDPEQYLLSETFNGEAAVPEEWTVYGGEAAVADVPFESDRSLRLTAEGSAAKATRILPEMSGLFSFEVMIRTTGIGFASMPILTDGENRIAAGVAFYHNNLYAVNGDNWVKVMDGESPWAYYPANNWYKIRLVLDTDANRYDLYVDGALRMKGLSFAEDVSEVSRVSFTLGTDNTAYIDSLYLYQGSSLAGGLIDQDNVINVKDAPYNAKGDGVTDDTLAIQRALDDAAFTGRTVLLEDGVFLTSTIQVKSDTTLYISPSATILGIREKNGYPLVESCEGLINYRQIGRGLILTENASNVRIEGGGTIDGNGFYGYRVNDPATSRRLSDARPCVILSMLSEDVTIQNVNLINSAFWTLVPMESRNVTIRNVSVNSMNTPNRDGIDPCDVINCTIENCNIIAGDDGLCFKSSSMYGCANIDVRNITIQSRSNGIKFGSDTYGALKNLSISDVTMKNVVKSGITMQSADGAEIENLCFERITMTDVDDPIFFTVGNRGRQPVSNPGQRIGYIRNVVLRDISSVDPKMPPYSYDTDVHEVLLIGLDEDHKIENVAFENVYLEMPGGYTAVPAWPNGVGGGYPEHYSAGGKSNAWAYCIKYAANITFKNCINVLLNEDVRPEYAYYDDYSDQPALYDHEVEYVLPLRITVNDGTEAGRNFPDTVEVALDDNTVVTIPVTWERADDYDLTQAGSYVIFGSLGEMEGVCNPSELKAYLTITVLQDSDPTPDPDPDPDPEPNPDPNPDPDPEPAPEPDPDPAPEPDPEEPPTEPEVPKTGDGLPLAAMLALISAAGIIVGSKKRPKEK